MLKRYLLLVLIILIFPTSSFTEIKKDARAQNAENLQVTDEASSSSPEKISYMGVIKNIRGNSIHVVVLDSKNNFIAQTYSKSNGTFRLNLPTGQYFLMLLKNNEVVLSRIIHVSVDTNHGDFQIPIKLFDIIKLSSSVNMIIGALLGLLISLMTWYLQKKYEAKELSKNIPLIIAPTRFVIDDLLNSILYQASDEKQINDRLDSLDKLFDAQMKDYSWIWSKVTHSQVKASLSIKIHIEALKDFLHRQHAMVKIRELRAYLKSPYDVNQIKQIKTSDSELNKLIQIILGFFNYIEWLKGKLTLL